jgi:fumarate hydratase class I
MTVIKTADVIQSVADALQYIACYHPQDYLHALHGAYLRESSPAAKDAMAQMLINSRLCAQNHRPICQDTGIVTAFVKVGMAVRWDNTNSSLLEMINQGVRQAYTCKNNPLRASVLSDPAGSRRNSGDNSPAIVHVELVAGDQLDISLTAKGGGSENKARFANLNPSDDWVDWVVNTMETLGAGWCPPGVLGLGIGGTADKAMLLAKQSLMQPIDLPQWQHRSKLTASEQLRLTIYNKINALGIGAQGLGGQTTVLDVKILDYPTHAASLPVALMPNCVANRHIHFVLDGHGAAQFIPPDWAAWPKIHNDNEIPAKKVDLNQINAAEIATWHSGQRLLLSGKILTGRDAAHKRIADLLRQGQALPIDFKGRFIYYVGPVDAVGDEAVGPAGPTTATRMDKFTDMMLSEVGILGMIGKAERGPATIASIKRHGSVYLIAVGGAAYRVSQTIKHAQVVAFADLGMEAIHEFTVEDMPVTVAVDSRGQSLHHTGPKAWKIKVESL